MKLTTSHQFEYSPSGRSAFFTSLIILFLLSIGFYFSIYRSQAAGGKTPAAPDPQMPMTEDHYINIPYFTESDVMHSTLTLNNNEAEAMTATLTIFNQKGERFGVPPITLQAASAARFSLKDLTATAKGDFDAGSVEIFYHGTSMGITSQVSIVSANHHLSFESVETEAMDFASTTLNGIAWTPDDETQAKLALTNTTSTPLDITAMGNEKVQSMTLRARETRIIDLKEYLADSRATLMTLNHHGPLGALIATGFALNEKSGFSTNLNFVDCATAKATRVAAAHVRFGQADPQEGFPAGTSFTAPLAIANTMDMPTEAQISVTYTVHSATKTVKLKPITLGAREVKLIELSKQMARNGVTGPVEDAGVDISYFHMPGTVIGRLTSYDASGDYSFDVPVKDPVDQGSGGYPWRLDNGYSTVVHLKNTVDKEITAVLQIRYDGGSYNPDRIKLAPYQTVAIDIRKLRDAQQKDIRGGVMPKDVESGQLSWGEEAVGSLIGRAEIAKVGSGIASSFSCGECSTCQGIVFRSCAMTPPSGSAGPGVIGYMFAPSVMKQDCHFIYGPYAPSSTITWSSTNTPVVTVDSAGNETTVALGSGTILAQWSEVVGFNYSCAAIYANVTVSATCDVVCAVPNNFHSTGSFDAGNGTLHFDYAWGSSTGHLADLAQCTVAEKVDYNSADLPFASPPFPAGINPTNPTILPNPPAAGNLGELEDNHSTPGSFVKPYSAKTITSTQVERYTCACANGGQPVVFWGPVNIVRSVSQNTDGSWKFLITKDGSSATINPLP